MAKEDSPESYLSGMREYENFMKGFPKLETQINRIYFAPQPTVCVVSNQTIVVHKNLEVKTIQTKVVSKPIKVVYKQF